MNTSAQPYKKLLLIKKKEGRAVAFRKALTILVAVNLLLIRVTNLARTAMNFVEGVFWIPMSTLQKKGTKLYHTHCSRSPPSMDRCASPITFLGCHCEQCYRAGDGRRGCRLDRNGIQNVRIVQKGCPTARNGSQLVWFCKYAAKIQHFNKLCVFETSNLALAN